MLTPPSISSHLWRSSISVTTAWRHFLQPSMEWTFHSWRISDWTGTVRQMHVCVYVCMYVCTCQGWVKHFSALLISTLSTFFEVFDGPLKHLHVCKHSWSTYMLVFKLHYNLVFNGLKAGSHLFCLHRIATGSLYKMIWTRVHDAGIELFSNPALRHTSKSFYMHFRSQCNTTKKMRTSLKTTQ